MVLVEISFVPIGVGESLSRYIAHCMDIIDKSGLNYQFHPMGTIIEGELEEVFDLIIKCRNSLRKKFPECNRLLINIKVDDRKGVKEALKYKIKSVEEKLGRTLTKSPASEE